MLLRAFTLVELLVVVTILVLLLMLMVPALERAVYAAELASCGANLKGIASAATQYAAGNKRLYPDRPTVRAGANWRRPNCIVDVGSALVPPADDRPYFQAYMPITMLADPLCGKIDLRAIPAGNHAFSNYELWYGMKFATAIGGGGLHRIGDRLAWTDTSRGQSYRNRFSVLASEEDLVEPSYDYKVCVSHPDSEGSTSQEVWNGGGYVLSRWIRFQTTAERGPIDANYAYADGGVTRIDRVEWDDDRMARVPLNADAAPADVGTGHWIHLPRQ